MKLNLLQSYAVLWHVYVLLSHIVLADEIYNIRDMYYV